MKLSDDRIWTQKIASQLIDILPKTQDYLNQCDHGFTPAFLYASRLLERLGYVENEAKFLETPRKTHSTTRYDDACHILLLCLEECQLINYGPITRELTVALAESYGVAAVDLAPAISDETWTKITGNQHSCDATVDPSAVSCLEALGLVANDRWTKGALPLLWRKWINMHPSGRPADTTVFQDRLEVHFASMPMNLVEELEEYLSFSEGLLLRKAELLGGRVNDDEVQRLAGQARLMDLEFMFSRRWRFTDGWLSKERLDECVDIGFDALAAEMAHAIVVQKYPNSDLALALQITPDVRGLRH